jgi:pimeloyl-ACP methyl ester carboxylesterase
LVAFGTSIWSSELIPFAIETRYRALMLLPAGIPTSESDALAEANAVNFVPRIGTPTLVLSGRHDESLSYEAGAAPLFALLPSPKSLRRSTAATFRPCRHGFLSPAPGSTLRQDPSSGSDGRSLATACVASGWAGRWTVRP